MAAARRYRLGDSRLGLASDAFDEVWAVFDWDEHADEVASARGAASDAGVLVALSNPCFEVWLLWHFTDYMRPGCFAVDVERALRSVWPQYEKGRRLDVARLAPERCSEASLRASTAAEVHESQGRRYPDNRPSSDVRVLVAHLINAWRDVTGASAICPIAPKP